jgi:pimeloyl-ACP methyl ester carboxylesterase
VTVHVFYLHGFVSSPRAGKASLLGERLAAHGLTLHAPDFNEPAFETLTTTRMIGQVEQAMAALPPGPIVLIGSSLGAFVAWHVAARAQRLAGVRRVDRLVLLAPALAFDASSFSELGEAGLQRWRDTDALAVMHHAYGGMRSVGYALYDDARQYDSRTAVVTVPALVFQGRRDALVDPAMVEAFVAARPSMTLRLLDDDHQLHASLGTIWRETAAFLGLTPARPA